MNTIHVLFYFIFASVAIQNIMGQYGYPYYPNYNAYRDDEAVFYASAFEEAAVNYSDFESQTKEIYRIFCQQGCADTEDHFRNKDCVECYCDSKCNYYSDCCPDYPQLNPDKQMEWSCSTRRFPELPTENIKLVHDCPVTEERADDLNLQIRDKCRNTSADNWRSVQPVSDLVTEVTYRNKFCAQCHGVQATPWQCSILCEGGPPELSPDASADEIYKTVLGSPDCSITFLNPPLVNVRGCKNASNDLWASCNLTGRWLTYDSLIDEACSTFPQNTVHGFKNVFCYLCNIGIDWDTAKSRIIGYDPTVFRIPLSALLDLDEDVTEDTDKSHDCPFWDPIKCMCRNVSCANNKRYEDGECRSVFQTSNSYVYYYCLQGRLQFQTHKVTPPEALIVYNKHMDLMADLNATLGLTLYDIKYLSPCGPNISLEFNLRTNAYFRNLTDTDNFEKTLLGFVDNATFYLENDIEVKLSLTETCPVQAGKLLINTDLSVPCEFYNTEDIITSQYKRRDTGIMESTTRIRFSKFYVCPRVVLSLSEAKLSPGNDSVLILKLNKSIKAPSFKIDDTGEILVCINDYTNHHDKKDSDPSCASRSVVQTDTMLRNSALGILSGICTTLSLLFLLITFVIFCCVKKLRTTIGLGVMALTFSLIVAQTLFEFGAEQTEIKWVCHTIGIVTHFFWLSSTFWMNVCTGILFYKLNYPIESRRISTRTTMILSTFYSWIVPALIITIVVVFSYLDSGELGYGGAACYITSPDVRRYSFALPVGVLVLTNIILFSYTFIKLKRSQKLKSNQESHIGMLACLKLSVITGLTWIFAYIYEVTKYQVFAYLFTIFVGSQGCVLFLAFIVNKRVFEMLRKSIQKTEKNENKDLKTGSKNDSTPKNSKKGNTNLSHLKTELHASDSVGPKREKMLEKFYDDERAETADATHENLKKY